MPPDTSIHTQAIKKEHVINFSQHLFNCFKLQIAALRFKYYKHHSKPEANAQNKKNKLNYNPTKCTLITNLKHIKLNVNKYNVGLA